MYAFTPKYACVYAPKIGQIKDEISTKKIHFVIFMHLI